MKTTFDPWLAELRAAGKGGVFLRGASRGRAWTYVFAVGLDVSAWSFRGVARLAPDAAGDPVFEFTVTPGAYAGGVTPLTLSLTAADTSETAADADGDGSETLAFDILADAGGDEFLFLGGALPILGSVTT